MASTITTNTVTTTTVQADTLVDTAGTGSPSLTNGIKTNTISERTAAAGVTIDGVLLKDSGITASALSTGVVHSNGSGVFSSSNIVNADVDAAAAIAGTKISPAFGSQNISTTGTLTTGAATITGGIKSASQTITSIVSGANNDFTGVALDSTSGGSGVCWLISVVYGVNTNQNASGMYVYTKQETGSAGGGTLTALATSFSGATTNLTVTTTNNGSDTIPRVVVTTTAAGGGLSVSALNLFSA